MLTNLEYGVREVLSHKLLNGLQVSSTQPQFQSVTISVATLELLRCPEATEGTVDHDPHPGTESLALGHAVCGDED